jgi:hypothetical protein
MAALAPSSTSLSFLKTSRLMFLSTVATAAPTIPFTKQEHGFVSDIENRFQANIPLSAGCQQQIWANPHDGRATEKPTQLAAKHRILPMKETIQVARPLLPPL